MAGLRAFYEEAVPEIGATVVLNEAEGRHLARVLRARVGEAVELLDGRGAICHGVFAGERGRSAAVTVQAVGCVPRKSPELCLVQALPKGKGMDGIIRQAVELGVARIYPVLSERSEVRLDDARRSSKAEHWQAVAREACKQSGNPWLPEIGEAQGLGEALAALPGGCAGLAGSLEEDARPVWDVLAGLPGTISGVAVAVGPEGDFSTAEYSLLRERGFLPVRLTALVLRVETAALAMLSIVEAWSGRGAGDLPG